MFKGIVREGELRRWAPWAGMVLLILLAAALETSMEGVCWDKDTARAAKIDEAAGCFEFWFNRYQTLIGALVTLVAAGIAWIGLKRQLERADEQIDVARRQGLIALLPALDQRAENATRVYSLAAALGMNAIRTKEAARTTLQYAFALRQNFESNTNLAADIYVYRHQVERYRVEISAFSERIEQFTIEWHRGLFGPDGRYHCEKIWASLTGVLDTHQDAMNKLSDTGSALPRSDLEFMAALDAAAKIDQRGFILSDLGFDIPLRGLEHTVVEIERERDRCRDASRI
ncbi:hypothetical protein [Methylobacterium sp. 1973]|uniref:hypothetical protein n=1 Tax=Methylobacterium sp. 1973 TaxID=3156421 RepID=UPI0033929809